MNTMRQMGLWALVALMVAGCKSTYDTKRVSEANVEREGSIVWVRPKRYNPLTSLRRRMEVTYEQATPNAAGLMEVKLGCRNKSGSDLVTYLKTAFYAEPVGAGGQMAPPVYETNWQRTPIVRGETHHYRVVCPRPEGMYYQITISEDLQ